MNRALAAFVITALAAGSAVLVGIVLAGLFPGRNVKTAAAAFLLGLLAAPWAYRATDALEVER